MGGDDREEAQGRTFQIKKPVKTSPTRDANPQQIREQFKHERSESPQVFVDRVLRDGWTV